MHNLKTEEAAQKLRAARAEVEKEAAKLLALATKHSALHCEDFGTLASLLKASEIAKKELAACMVEGFV